MASHRATSVPCFGPSLTAGKPLPLYLSSVRRQSFTSYFACGASPPNPHPLNVMLPHALWMIPLRLSPPLAHIFPIQTRLITNL